MQKTGSKRIRIIDKTTFMGVFKLVSGFMMGAARVGNMRPFGIAYAAASPNDDLWRFCGAFLGSILVWGGKGGILYAAAIMICFACRMVFRDTQIGKNRAFLPVASGLSVICVRSAGLLSSLSVKSLTSLIFEGALTVMVSMLFSLTDEDKPRGVYLISRAVMLIAALFSLEPMRILGLFSLARSVASVAVIAMGYFYGSGAGAGAGIALGALFDMAVFSTPKLAFIYGLGGLLCGGGKDAPRALRGAMWIVGCISAYVWCGLHSAGIVAECVICGLGVCILPSNVWEKVEKRFQSVKTAGQYETMPELSAAIAKMGDEIGKTPPVRRGNEMQKVLDRAADGVCATCPQAGECWRYDYVATSGALLGVGAVAKEKSEIGLDDFPKHFVKKCKKPQQLCKEINRQLRASRSRAGAAKRKEENAALMKRQYQGMSSLFTDISVPKTSGDRAVLSTEVFSCSKARKNENECGDTVSYFVTSDSRQIVLLSDGMGSGSKAASASKNTVEMLRDLIAAGAGLIAATEAVAPVLEAKFESNGFVTLDALQIDLTNGEAVFVKYGASPSYILRGEVQKQVWKQSLPAGLGGEAAILKVNLKAGDKVVMISDGVSVPKAFCGNGEELCNILVNERSDDDKTALTITLKEV